MRLPYAAFLLRLMIAAAACAGCAALPDIHALRSHLVPDRASTATPIVADQRGMLDVAQTEAILRKLRQEGKTDVLDRHLAFMQALRSPPLVRGNMVALLIDGPATYRAMFEAIAGARDHVNLETYIFDEDGPGTMLAELLRRKAAEGVRVNLLYDSVGSLQTRREFFEQLRSGGVQVCEFNPVSPWRGRLFSLNHRDHRKILVVDGKEGFTGGINISGVYSRSSFPSRQRRDADAPWRDTHISLRGPAVHDLQRLFLDSWHSQGCGDAGARDYFPQPAPAGDMVVRTLGSGPREGLNLIYAELLSAILHAEHTLHMTMAYFIPDAQTVAALKAAAQRGVDVQLVLPGFSDYRITFYAGRSYYDELLAAGVKIYERKDALLHAKTAVIDGVWSTVGSTNIDMRSFLYNDEVNVVVLGRKFGLQMEQLFELDRQAAVPIDPDAWRRRGTRERAKEDFARIWAPLL